MDREIIKDVAITKGLKGKDLYVFVEFFDNRFLNESNRILSYVGEWADRFISGDPESYCDIKSLGVLKEARKKFVNMR